MGDSPYRHPAKPVIHNGITMRSQTEGRVATALDRIGIDYQYEPERLGDYLPDFHIANIAYEGIAHHSGDLWVEVRPDMVDAGFREKGQFNAAMLKLYSDAPLIFVGLEEFPASLLGWCFGVEIDEPVLAAIAQRRKLRYDGNNGFPEPCLYVGAAANIWVDGFLTAAQETDIGGQLRF